MFRTVEVSYHNNDPHGMRFYSLKDSVVEGVVVPKGMLREAGKLMSDERMSSNGVYFLCGEENGVKRMYAGQTTKDVERFNDHKRKKSWWTKAILFVSEKFAGDILDSLEATAIKSIFNSHRYTTDNVRKPEKSVSVFKRDLINKYFDDIKFIMETLNLSLATAADGDKGDWRTKRNGIVAYGRYYEDRFDVLPGSSINMRDTFCAASYLALREELKKNKLIVEESPGKFILKSVQSFFTPSGAAAFVLGHNANGWTSWFNNKGEPLDILRKEED